MTTGSPLVLFFSLSSIAVSARYFSVTSLPFAFLMADEKVILKELFTAIPVSPLSTEYVILFEEEEEPL